VIEKKRNAYAVHVVRSSQPPQPRLGSLIRRFASTPFP
jgi:hypothetical protein